MTKTAKEMTNYGKICKMWVHDMDRQLAKIKSVNKKFAELEELKENDYVWEKTK